MNLLVLHASPTGEHSVTLQYLRFLQKRHPEHHFHVVDVGRPLTRLGADKPIEGSLVHERLLAQLPPEREADAVLWSFPVYTFLAPAAMVRFVEILSERLPVGALDGKVASVLTTSEHFFDHTAHAWMEEVSEDLGMRVFKGYSARTEELLAPAGQESLLAWMREFTRCVEERAPIQPTCRPISWSPPTLRLQEPAPVEKVGTHRIALITDIGPGEENLRAMVELYRQQTKNKVDEVNLREIEMKGGCLGCLQCVYDGSCIYRDGFARHFDERIRAADALVFAGTLRRRYLSHLFKAYFDRNFRNGHRPILQGRPMGWILSGPLRQLPTLRQILEAKGEVQQSPRLGIVTDEDGDPTAQLVELARATDRLLEAPWIRPATFLGVGGRKIFRDLMWNMRGIVRADHHYYRREGLYDFPQRDRGRTLFNWAMALMMAIPWTRRWTLRKIGELKIAAFRKVLEAP